MMPLAPSLSPYHSFQRPRAAAHTNTPPVTYIVSIRPEGKNTTTKAAKTGMKQQKKKQEEGKNDVKKKHTTPPARLPTPPIPSIQVINAPPLPIPIFSPIPPLSIQTHIPPAQIPHRPTKTLKTVAPGGGPMACVARRELVRERIKSAIRSLFDVSIGGFLVFRGCGWGDSLRKGGRISLGFGQRLRYIWYSAGGWEKREAVDLPGKFGGTECGCSCWVWS